MSEHTPGPWTADYEVFIKLWGEWVTEVRGPSGMDVIAIVNLGRDEKRPQLKNVSLIEAAPDLLAALERTEQTLRNMLGSHWVHPGMGDTYTTLNNERKSIQAAIARARGES